MKDYTYCNCTRCKILFLNPPPTQKTVEDYYAHNFNYEEGINNETVIRNRAKIVLTNLLHLNPKGKNLLDIGSGYGFFLDEAQKFNLKLTGIEPSKKLFLRSAFRLASIKNMNFEQFYQSKLKKRYDFITVTHVIEHTSRPRFWLKALSSLLNPGGILYIETPNLDSHLFYAEKYFYTFLTPPNHIFLFSKRSFFRMIRHIRNLRIVRVKTYSHPEHFMGIVKQILRKNAKIPVLNDLRGAQSERSEASTLTEMKNAVSSILKKIKYVIIDKIIAVLLYRFLNIGDKGSILELYIRKI